MKLIAAASELAELNQALRGAETLYLDTEFESNRSGIELCLLQISTGTEIYLVDAIAIKDLRPLAEAFQGNAEWVLHAGQQDVMLLGERLDLHKRPRVFDTQIAWSLSTVEHSVSLAYAQFRALGLRATKAHQADDWVRRPCRFPACLRRRGRRAFTGSVCVLEASREHAGPRRSGAARFCRKYLGRRRAGLAVGARLVSQRLAARSQRTSGLRYLIQWFNQLPERERENAPENKTLLSLASRLPRSVDDLQRIKGVPRGWSRELSQSLVTGLTKAAEGADATGFTPIDPPAYATKRELLVDGWLAAARADVCVSLEVAPEIALPSRIMKGLRGHVLSHGGENAGASLEGWRHTLLGRPVSGLRRGISAQILTLGTALASPSPEIGILRP